MPWTLDKAGQSKVSSETPGQGVLPDRNPVQLKYSPPSHKALILTREQMKTGFSCPPNS